MNVWAKFIAHVDIIWNLLMRDEQLAAADI